MSSWPKCIAAFAALTLPLAVAHAEQDTHRFDVPAGEATVSITVFALQAGRQIIVPADALAGQSTKALRGTFDTRQALETLLGNTPLSIKSDDGQVIVLASKEAIRPELRSPQQIASDETIYINGYRASLENAAQSKKASVSFTDSIFAEDIGKFPDTNIAESLNRIPGILLTRDANGEGIQVAIRGLSTDFTKILLNDAPIMVAGGGIIDASNSNREVDLNVFPGELFTEARVTKTARADILEGGAAGTVTLKMRRPFDTPGPHLSYTLQSISNTLTNGSGGNGAVILSDTWNANSLLGDFGILIGFAARKSYQYNDGWEDGNGGWVTPSIVNSTLCGAASGCDIAGSTVSIGGDSMAIPAAVPANVAIPGYPAGTTVTASMLTALNPGLTITQISNMLLPRLPRSMYERGTRDRYNAVVSLEWRPDSTLNAYIDFSFSQQIRRLDRSDIDLGIRSGNAAQPIIPANVTIDAHGVVQTALLYNAQFGLEARDYKERFDFFFLNPGFVWKPSGTVSVKAQLNASRSHYIRDTPTIYLASCPSSGTPSDLPGCTPPADGVVAYFDNTDKVPNVTTNIDLNDPDNFQWYGGRASLMFDRRYTTTYGGRIDFDIGDETLQVKAGAAYDVYYRSITGIDRTGSWQSVVCQNGSNGACAGKPNSLIPQPSLAGYLYPGPDGFVAVDYDKFKAATGYSSQRDAALSNVPARCTYQLTGFGFAPGTAAGATSGCFEERNSGFYGQVDGTTPVYGRDLRFNLGLRWTETRQTIKSPVKQANNDYSFTNAVHNYQAFLPSMNIAYTIGESVQARASWSRTMTRASVSQMIQAVSFTDFNAQSATLGNPNLKPYFSNNIDLGVEVYTGQEGFLSLALFRKDISGFSTSQILSQPFSYLAQYGITWTSLSSVQKNALTARAGCTSDADCAATINITQQINAPGIESINGLELTYVQPLEAMFGERAAGFGVSANMTAISQSSSGSAAVHAIGVAPYSLNLTAYYDKDGLMSRLSYTFRDRSYGSASNMSGVCLPNITAASAGCPEGAYTFNGAYGQADLSASVKLSKLALDLPSDPDISLNVQNLFGAKQFSYFQYKNAVDRYYRTGQTVMFGLHGSF
jgi:TonB-dependent receptor